MDDQKPSLSGITFTAIYEKDWGTADGGRKITFACDQSEAYKLVQISQLNGSLLQLAVIPMEAGDYLNG